VRKLTSRPGFTAGLLGSLLLLELAAARLVLQADNDFVYFLGHRINYVCSVRERFGIPCPACGLSRGFVLTVHGSIGDAWRLSPTGPLAAMGMFSMGLALLVLAWTQRSRSSVQTSRVQRVIRTGALTYAAAGTLVWGISWLMTILSP